MALQALRYPAIRGAFSEEPHCPICNEMKRFYLFIVCGLPVVRCHGCGLVSLNPYPDMKDCCSFYGISIDEQDPRLFWTDSKTEREAARHYVATLKNKGLDQGRLLLIAPPEHPFAVEAAKQGFEVGLHVSIREIEDGHEFGGNYDGAVVIYQLEKAADPFELLRRIHAALRRGGVLTLTVPSLDSWSARFFGDHWTEWRPENKYYFDTKTAHSILLKSGFAEVWSDPERRSYTLRHIYDRSLNFPDTMLTQSIAFSYKIVPSFLRDWHIRLTTSRRIFTAVKSDIPTRPRLSIILPAYNEEATFAQLMDSLLAKQMDGIDREIIIVESNSKDGTQEIAKHYQHHPDVRLVLQDRPKGKGNAVRLGFEHAGGDIILIQDADLEYDLNDYEALLENVISYRSLFVLGARHGGNWKMRRFASKWSLATLLNLGHIFFVKLINLLYRQHLSDPFTMYKVFRRDCIFGIEFECNRFDFDHELVIKLIRKGYEPLEIPVNYWSRSFKEGKKVRLFRDPLRWLWVDLKYRFMPSSSWRKR